VARRPLERERIYLDGGRRTTQLMRDSLDGGSARMQILLAIGFLALVAGVYSSLAWKAAVRFGRRSLLLTWLLGSLLLLSFIFARRPPAGMLPTHAYAIGAFAVFLAFGLATRTVGRRITHSAPSQTLTLFPIAAATGAFFLGLLVGLLPLLMLDMLTIVG
jgi:hypothetical protein